MWRLCGYCCVTLAVSLLIGILVTRNAPPCFYKYETMNQNQQRIFLGGSSTGRINTSFCMNKSIDCPHAIPVLDRSDAHFFGRINDFPALYGFNTTDPITANGYLVAHSWTEMITWPYISRLDCVNIVVSSYWTGDSHNNCNQFTSDAVDLLGTIGYTMGWETTMLRSCRSMLPVLCMCV
jgi:uncharacterized membrane protein